MGHNNRNALVSMTNNDVYYVTEGTAKKLMALIAQRQDRGQPPAFFETVDAKSGAQIAIAMGNISSIVIPREANHA